LLEQEDKIPEAALSQEDPGFKSPAETADQDALETARTSSPGIDFLKPPFTAETFSKIFVLDFRTFLIF
jgi:hypothetical protein